MDFYLIDCYDIFLLFIYKTIEGNRNNEQCNM